MTDRPIIFSAPMVRALLAGRKTQTRRVLKPQPVLNVSGLWVWPPDWVKGAKRGVACVQTDAGGLKQSLEFDPSRTLRYAPGDRLWVREAHKALLMGDFPVLWYKADDSDKPISANQFFTIESKGWRSPIHMPRWASRLTLLVTDVRVQRVQEISEEDAEAEGCRPAFTDTGNPAAPVCSRPSYRWGFPELWNSIHGPDAWDRNDWVAALTFTVEQRNIDE